MRRGTYEVTLVNCFFWRYDLVMPPEQNPKGSSAMRPKPAASRPDAVPEGRSDIDSPTVWLDEHGDYLFAYAFSRIADTHIAEDLVQETLLGAMQSRERFEHGSSVRTWLTSILRHKLVDHLRRANRGGGAGTTSIDSYPDEEALERFADSQFDRRGKWRILPGRWAPPSTDPASSLENEEFRRVLAYCLEKLPPKPAEVINLVQRKGMSLEQMSKILDITATNAGVLLHRARLALRRCLELNWFRDS